MSPSADRPFELRVMPRGEEGFALELWQYPTRSAAEAAENPVRLVEIRGDPLRGAMDPILQGLRRSGYRPTDLHRERRAPFRLTEEEGVRLGVLFLAVKPLRKGTRILAVSDHVRGMQPEEAFYWFSKTTSRNSGRRAQRALRLLMAED